jgi:NAD(P)-dependent dehydrogenase (short-subunit alcohol dehydrogenase family)
VTWGEPLETFPYKAWAKVLDVNVTGLFHLTRQLLPLLDAAAADADPARIINLGSVMGTQPIADGAYSYTASKAAVHHLTKTMATEFAERRITVNAFAPGPFQSRMTAFATGVGPRRRQGGPAGAAWPHRRAGRHWRGDLLPLWKRRQLCYRRNLCRLMAASRSSMAWPCSRSRIFNAASHHQGIRPRRVRGQGDRSVALAHGDAGHHRQVCGGDRR